MLDYSGVYGLLGYVDHIVHVVDVDFPAAQAGDEVQDLRALFHGVQGRPQVVEENSGERRRPEGVIAVDDANGLPAAQDLAKFIGGEGTEKLDA